MTVEELMDFLKIEDPDASVRIVGNSDLRDADGGLDVIDVYEEDGVVYIEVE